MFFHSAVPAKMPCTLRSSGTKPMPLVIASMGDLNCCVAPLIVIVPVS